MVARSLFALLPFLMVGGCLNGTEPNPLDHPRRTGAEPTPGEGEPDGAGAGDDGKVDGDAPGQTGGGDDGGLGDEADLPVEGDLPCAIDKVMVDECQSCHGARLRFGAPMPLVTLADFHAPAITSPSRSVFELVYERMQDDARPMPPAPAKRTSEEGIEAIVKWVDSGALSGTRCADDDWQHEGGQGGGDTAGAEDGGNADGGSDDGGGGDGGGGDGGGGEDVLERPTVVPYDECDYLLELRAHERSQPGDETPYEVPRDNNHYQCFEFRVPWNAPVHGLAFSPIIDDDRVVHHWLLYGQNGGAQDGRSRGCGGQHDGAALLAGWAPGGGPWILPEGVGLQVPHGEDGYFVLEIHYNNAAGHRDARDRSGVEVCATSEQRQEEAAVHWLGSELILLLGDGNHTVQGTCNPRSDEPIHLLTSWPHMHKRGRHMKMVVKRRGGDDEVLIDEPFDFNNQIGYWTPTTLQPGDSIQTTCTFENSGGMATYGPNTENEMCYNFVVAWPAGALQNGRGAAGNTNFCLF